jgi:hypothetical protein
LIWGGDSPWRGLALRRLQVAAQAGGALALLFRGEAAARDPSPAALRLQVHPTQTGLAVRILRQRGGHPTGVLELGRP